RRVKQTTQFIVGAADETDREIVKYVAAGYERLNLHRVYFSAWQPGEIPLLDLDAVEAARSRAVREHRLYQVDFLLRKYGFTADDIAFDDLSNLDANVDPKTLWANLHPEFFPLNINKASKVDLLKIPGLGPTTVARILDVRKSGGRVTSLDQVGKLTKTLQKAENYIRFD
ncbi:MAG: helix-hairpin-helix domain-containing protein, partial [Thermoguttaceae bacterium]|nr:helix-hairpin-helix domain-containing protein [Thermoguttaceae bacterium]